MHICNPQSSLCLKIIALSIIICSCSHSPYRITNDTTYRRESSQAVATKLIYLNETELPNSNEAIKFINRGWWNSFANNYAVTNKETQQLLTAYRFIQEKNYLSSYNILKNLPEQAFDCQVLILKTDCLKELHADSIDYFERYQKAMDCATNTNVKEIAKKRFRLAKYGY